MITYWQQDGEKLVDTEKEKLASSKRVWIDARNVTREDINILEKEFKIEQEHIIDILDPDELSRIEDADGYTLTITRLPIFVPTAVHLQFNTKDTFGILSETGSGGTLEISLNREPKVQGESRISQAKGQSGSLMMQPVDGCT